MVAGKRIYLELSLGKKKSGFQGLNIRIKSTGSAVTKVPIFKPSAGERRWLLMVATERNWRDEGAQDKNEDPHEPDEHSSELSCCHPGQKSVVNTIFTG